VVVAGERLEATPDHGDQVEVGILGQTGQGQTLDLAVHDLQVVEVGEGLLGPCEELEPAEVGAEEGLVGGGVAAQPALRLPGQLGGQEEEEEEEQPLPVRPVRPPHDNSGL